MMAEHRRKNTPIQVFSYPTSQILSMRDGRKVGLRGASPQNFHIFSKKIAAKEDSVRAEKKTQRDFRNDFFSLIELVLAENPQKFETTEA